MDLEDARKIAQAWCAAWNCHDIAAIMEHYADEVEFSSPTVVKRWGVADGWLRGKDKLQAHFAVGLAVPGLKFELLDVLLGVNSLCIVYRRESGATVSDCVELDVHGKARRVMACYGGIDAAHKGDAPTGLRA